MPNVDDLFPQSRRPESLGADAVPYLWPTFFAIYPTRQDLPHLLDWQQRICAQGNGPIAATRPKLLHVSLSECGTPKQKRQTLPDALAEAARYFSFPAFDLVFDSVAQFGKDGCACVAVADAASQKVFEGLRAAVANAQRRIGMFVSRGKHEAHLTLGYGEGLQLDRRNIEPFAIRAEAVEFVASDRGKSHHEHLARWPLTAA